VNAEQRIFAWLERADFDGTGCRWSQENIAAACQCSRRTVIRATQKLAAEGRIDSFLERRPGCKWPCRVYRVKHWNPHKRAGVLNVLRAIREARKAECHTEKNGNCSKGSDPVGSPVSPRCTQLKDQRGWSREKFEIRSRRTSMDQRRRHLHVADLTCLHCAEKQAELERKADIIEALQRELNKSMENEAGALAAAKAAGNALNAAKGQLTKDAESSPNARQVRRVLDAWVEGRRGRPNVEAGGKRWRTVQKALALGHTNPPLECPVHDETGAKRPDVPESAVCSVVDELIEAIQGIRLFPFMRDAQRTEAMVPGAKKFDDVDHALGDEKRIEKARMLARWAKADRAQRAWVRYWAAQEAADYWRELVVEGLAERRRRPVAEMAEKAMRENGEQA
jgi:hypothetical protein